MKTTMRSINWENVKKFLKKKWWVVLIGLLLLPILFELLIIIVPIAFIWLVWFMWSKEKWSRKTRIVITAVPLILLSLIIIVGVTYKGPQPRPKQKDVTAVATQKIDLVPQAVAPQQNQLASDTQAEQSQQAQDSKPQQDNAQNSITTSQSSPSKNDFSIYEDFFTLRNQQFKIVDQFLSGLSPQKHKELAVIPNPTTTPEWSTLSDASDALYLFSDKLDKNDPLQNSVATAIDDYSTGAVDSYRDWVFTNEQSSRTDAESQRSKGDQELNNLLVALKKQGYKGTVILNISSIATTPASDEIKYKASCKNISYKLLEKDPTSHMGESVHFKGLIQQAGTGAGSDWFRISVTPLGYGSYIDTVWVTTQNSTAFVEGDVVNFWGEVGDSKCYQSQANFNICIPSVDAQYISK